MAYTASATWQRHELLEVAAEYVESLKLPNEPGWRESQARVVEQLKRAANRRPGGGSRPFLIQTPPE